nr:50S ribosomal protein L4 [Gammaproteobacteria bacterium]
LEDVSEATYLSVRNLPNILIMDAEGVDPVSLVRYPHIVTTPAALKILEERLG